MATGPQHYCEAERYLAQAADWMDADLGWKGQLSTSERLAHRTADLLAAQAHAQLAQAAATAQGAPLDGEEHSGMAHHDAEAWYQTAGTRPTPKEH